MYSWESKLYVFGGFSNLNGVQDPTHTSFNDLYEFDTATKVWTELTPAVSPSIRGALACAGSGPAFYVFGGFEVVNGSVSENIRDDLWRYDIATNSWTDLGSNGPDPHFGNMLAQVGDSLYLSFGGCEAGSLTESGAGECNDHWMYDIPGDR